MNAFVMQRDELSELATSQREEEEERTAIQSTSVKA
jgi:hypothetical protein